MEKDQILYLWINKTSYSCFENNEFNFSPSYHFHFDKETKTLFCERKYSFNVFSDCENISNISAIVGNNGAGKSTLLKYFMEINHHYSSLNTYGLNDESAFIFIRLSNGLIEVLTSNNLNPTISKDDEFGNVNVFEGSSVVNLLKDTSFIYLSLESQTSESFKKNTSKRFIPLTPLQIKNDSNYFRRTRKNNLFNRFYFSSSFKDVYEKLILADCYSNFYYDDILDNKDNIFYVKVKLLVEQSGYFLRNAFSYSGLELRKKSVKNLYSCLTPDSLLLVNLLCEMIKNDEKVYIGKDIFGLSYRELREIVLAYIQRINDVERSVYYNQSLSEIDEFSFLTQRHLIKEDINEINNCYCVFTKEKMKSLIDLILEPNCSFIYKYLDIEFDKSDGESAYLRHTAYLYYISNIKKYLGRQRYEVNQNVVLLLDEIDVHLHPEWQRQLINNTIKTVNRLFPYKNVQILFTTHSPIVLSDIPAQNVIYIKKENNLTRKVYQRLDYRTFGANIFDLYNDSFFFNGETIIGDFAKRYIINLLEIIENNQNNKIKEKLSNQINIIGEPLIRNRLLELLLHEDKKDPANINPTEILKGLEDEKKHLEESIEYWKKVIEND